MLLLESDSADTNPPLTPVYVDVTTAALPPPGEATKKLRTPRVVSTVARRAAPLHAPRMRYRPLLA